MTSIEGMCQSQSISLSALKAFFMSEFSPSVGADRLPRLSTIRCHGATGGRMKRDSIRADSLDYIDSTMG